jgi:hypothetical protein
LMRLSSELYSCFAMMWSGVGFVHTCCRYQHAMVCDAIAAAGAKSAEERSAGQPGLCGVV